MVRSLEELGLETSSMHVAGRPRCVGVSSCRETGSNGFEHGVLGIAVWRP